jgi:hypothetical protein
MGRTARRLSESYRSRRSPTEGNSCPWRAASCRRWGWARKPIEKAQRTAWAADRGAGGARGIDGLAQPAFHPRSSDGEAGRGHVGAGGLPENTPVGQRRGRSLPESHPPGSDRQSHTRPRMATCAQLFNRWLEDRRATCTIGPSLKRVARSLTRRTARAPEPATGSAWSGRGFRKEPSHSSRARRAT